MDDKAGRPPAALVAYSCYLEAEGYEFAIRAYLIPLILVRVVGQSLVSLARAQISPLGEGRKPSLRRSRMDSRGFAGALPYWLGGVFYGPAELSMDSVAVTDVMSGAIHSWFNLCLALRRPVRQ